MRSPVAMPIVTRLRLFDRPVGLSRCFIQESTPAHGSGRWPARGQAPAGVHGWLRSRPAPGWAWRRKFGVAANRRSRVSTRSQRADRRRPITPTRADKRWSEFISLLLQIGGCPEVAASFAAEMSLCGSSGRRPHCVLRRRPRFGPWQVNLDGRPLPDAAPDTDGSAGLPDEPEHRRKAQTRALADPFCREEGLERALDYLGAHARSR